MLIEFRTENHRSIRDEQVLSLVASSMDADDPRLFRSPGLDDRLLRAAAIYGANASGKSNLIHALLFMGTAVIESAGEWDPEGGVPRHTFWLGPDPAARPSSYELNLLVDDVRYRYGFVVDDERVLEEWLYAWPKGRRWRRRSGSPRPPPRSPSPAAGRSPPRPRRRRPSAF